MFAARSLFRTAGRTQRSACRFLSTGQPKIVYVNTQDEYKAMNLAIRNASDTLVMRQWTASWCKVCTRIEPDVQKMLAESEKPVALYKIDTTALGEEGMANGVTNLPTWDFFYQTLPRQKYTEAGSNLAKLKQLMKGAPENANAALAYDEWVTRTSS